MNIAEFSIKNRVLVNLITIVAIVYGTIATLNMQREAFPAVDVDWVIVNTLYPGASPQEVEKLITMPIEDVLKNIDGIDTYGSGSREGYSTIFIELEPNLKNKDSVLNEISREVDKVVLPGDAEDPQTDEYFIMHPLIEISFTGNNITEERLREHVKSFEEIVKNIDGVGAVDRFGWRDEEISIEVDPNDLEKYYISLSQVINSINNQNVNLPGGKITSRSKELILRTVGEIEDVKGFEEIIIRTNSDGKYLKVGDVARVRETYAEERTIYKTNGSVSINLMPKKKDDGDTINIVDNIKAEVKRYRKNNGEEINIALVNDMAFYVKRRLNVLLTNGKLGLILLMITLLIFLNGRVAIVTAIGIPFAFLTALLFMSFLNVSLNLLTMFGLILVLGMIVDDAIVVSENVYRHIEEGLPVKEAVIVGVGEVAAPVTTTILTTAAAFVPLMFISGIMGKFLKFFPMGVILCLIASLFEALVILPAHLAEWVKPVKTKKELEESGASSYIIKSKSTLGKIILIPVNLIRMLLYFLFSAERKGNEAVWFQKLLSGYTKLLSHSLKNRFKLCFAALLVLVGAIIFSAKVMQFKMFPDAVEILYLRVESAEGTPLKETDKILSKIEDIVIKLPSHELKNIIATIGSSAEIGGGINDKFGTQYAQCILFLTEESARDRKADAIIEDLRKQIENARIPGLIKFEFEKAQGGPPVGKPIAVEVRGDDYNVLQELSEKIKNYMSSIDGVNDIKDNYELDKEEIQIIIDKKEAARLGLSVRRVASTIRYAFEGGVATTMRRKDEEVDVIVRLPEIYRNNLNTLRNLTIPNDRNRLIRLNKVASFKKERGVKKLNHQDGKRNITITAGVNEDKITSIEANMRIRSEFIDIPLEYPGYYFKIGGEWEDTTESIQSMFKAFGIALVLIYVILATQFKSFIQPFIIMVSVPFGLIGVIFALYFHGQPISIMALFGVVGLTGVVVNDALIFVDFINKRKDKGMDTLDAIMEAGRTRLRPILLTSITTIIALVPLIYGIGGEEPFIMPAAISMAYGLLAATFLTLIIVPCIYLIIDNIRLKFARKQC